MARRRSDPNNIGLPMGWRLKHGAYRYQVPEHRRHLFDNKAEFTLGKTLDDAFRVWNERMTDGKRAEDEYGDVALDAILEDALYLGCHTGVYFLIHGDEIVYIGASCNVLSRILQHADKIYDRIFFIPVDPLYLVTVEMNYIQKYKPKYNHHITGVPRKESSNSPEFRLATEIQDK